MKFFRLLCLLPALVILLATCKEAGAPTDANGNPTGNVTTTLAGIVVDESGQPVSSAAIIANGKNAVTDKYGTFMIQNAVVPGTRCFIICKKNGYFTGSRAEVPNSGGITELRLTLQSNAPGYTVNSSSGGTVSIGTASVKFPPSAFVTSDGNPFTGTVKVAAKHLDPSQPSFYNSFSGDMTARRTDGTQTELLSYGVLRVRLTDDVGNELKLAVGKTATLTYPIAAAQQKTAPTSMPLWYFDEALGMWKEEGVAVKSGDVYTGEVSHFTSWNCDYPVKTGIVKGRVMCNNEGVADVLLTVGQRKAFTDKNGYFSTRVPMNVDFTISILSSENEGLSAHDIHVRGLNEGEERTATLQSSICPAYLTGFLVDCNDKPIAGRIIVTYSDGYKYYGTSTGEFKIRVPIGPVLAIEATTFDGKIAQSRSIGTVSIGDKKDIGRITACENGNASDYVDIALGIGNQVRYVFSPDGSLIVMTGIRDGEGVCFVEVYDTKTGIKLCQITDKKTIDNYCMNAINFSGDGSRLLLTRVGENTATIVNSRTGEIIRKLNTNDVISAWLLSNGNEVIVQGGYDSGYKFSLYSVASGSKIKDISFNTMSLEWKLAGSGGGSSKLVIEYGEMSQTRVVVWDIASDTQTSDIVVVGSHGHEGTESSPDYRVISTFDFSSHNGMTPLNYFSTATGLKINTIPYVVNHNDAIGIGDDMTFVRQRNEANDTLIPPTIFNISNGNALKTLEVPSPHTRYWDFVYSSNSQYIAATEQFSMADPPMVVRIWKVK